MTTVETFNYAVREALGRYRAALPRAVECGLYFAAGATLALQALDPMGWTVVLVAFSTFLIQGTAIALLIGRRSSPSGDNP